MTRKSATNRAKSTRRKSDKPANANAAVSSNDTATTADNVLYAIRDIIEERIVRGKLQYKIDWADNPVTAERYDPTWVRFPTDLAPLRSQPFNSLLALTLFAGASRERDRGRNRRVGEGEAPTGGQHPKFKPTSSTAVLGGKAPKN